jgi:hypothetical protein
MHCSREELLRWAKAGAVGHKKAEQHLAECGECSLLWELFLTFAGAADVPLTSAPSGWIERALAIAGHSRPEGTLEKIAATLVFDSWLSPSFAGLRGAKDTDARRLRWEAGEWLLDLRAETGTAGWEMVAQVQRGGEAVAGVVVGSGAEKVHTDKAGLAVWSSRRPPRQISLHTEGGLLQCGAIAWSRPKRG